ncbi:MAG: HD domain-containing protein [Bdellovibrionales bacterium]|nr:HD domain-containing protein [Bdellovibrionales bacterium]
MAQKPPVTRLAEHIQKPSVPKNASVIFDVLHGFIPVTDWEEKIISSAFFQRLRWIKQLSFSNYIFPGAEHTRFSHAIGVMHSMHRMLRALGLAVTDDELFDPRATSAPVMLHKSLRISALLHDIGTFPFSHSIENAYIRHGNDARRTREDGEGRSKDLKELPNNHEHLGSFIIKNTSHEGGITRILEDYGIDVAFISRLIKGDSQYLIANQLMHSDLDSDRMDYLLRDAHYTGIQYGQFDREYLLANLVTYSVGKDQLGFGVRESAIHAVEDFLISRFHWYSQVVRNPGTSKFDRMSTRVAKALLEKDLIHQFQDLLELIDQKDERFFWWNDHYFITRCQEIRYQGLIQDPKVSEQIEMLLYRRAPKTVQDPLFQHRLLDGSKAKRGEREKLIARVKERVGELESALEKHGTGTEWILAEVPEKGLQMATGMDSLTEKGSSENLYLERDPVKLVSKDGTPSLLLERENSLIRHLANLSHFVPSVYVNDSALKLLRKKGLVTG